VLQAVTRHKHSEGCKWADQWREEDQPLWNPQRPCQLILLDQHSHNFLAFVCVKHGYVRVKQELSHREMFEAISGFQNNTSSTDTAKRAATEITCHERCQLRGDLLIACVSGHTPSSESADCSTACALRRLLAKSHGKRLLLTDTYRVMVHGPVDRPHPQR
jgi:hypothetical protein